MTTAAPSSRDRIVEIRVSGLRTAADVRLSFEPMNVLIGPNGVGKSTLIEGLEILRKLDSTDLLRSLNDDHGGVQRLLRHGDKNIRLGVSIHGGGTPMTYEVMLEPRGGALILAHEVLFDDGAIVMARDGDQLLPGPAFGQVSKPTSISPKLSALGWAAFSPHVRRMTAALAGIEIHVPFATQPRWFGPGMVPERNMRTDNLLQAAGRLDRGGANLANAYHALRNRSDWSDTLETIKLIVDDDIISISTPASASGGNLGLAVAYRTAGTIPAFALSDGTLALLALVAIAKLDEDAAPRSLLVLDEPDLHLDPGAIGHVVALLEACSARQPVVIATHSDRLLDCLSEPARATVLCDLDEQRRLRLRRPDQALLERWLTNYRGVGDLRAAGYDQLVFRSAENA